MEQLVSIVIPTKNEEKNIGSLLWKIAANVSFPYEVIVIDDSDNNFTLTQACLNGARIANGQGKGLGQAIIDGIELSLGDVVVVMDADFSHNPVSIPELVKPIHGQGYDLAIGSRYVKGGEVVGWTLKRKLISKVASLMAFPVTFLHDNTSGFFAFRKEILDGVKLKASSWKIMLEVLIKADPIAVIEVPIRFEDRKEGQSKFNRKEVRNYLVHLAKLVLCKYKAIIKFGTIGLSGAGIHFLVLYGATEIIGIWYIASAVLSIIVASSWNYGWNHFITFYDRQISNHLIGWTKYQLMSGVTDAIYLGLLALFTEVFGVWYMASAGLAVLLVFPVKFAVASGIIWSKKISVSDADYEWNAFFRGSPIQKWWKRSIAETVWRWVPNASELLDIGCGSSPIISKYDEAVGIDSNEKKLEFMGRKLGNHTFVNKRTEEFKDGEFDHVLCIEVLEHVENPVHLVKEISRLLKPEGRAVIATPDYSKRLWRLAERFTPYGEEHHNNFTMDKLDRLCEKFNLFPLKYKYVAGCDLVEEFVKVA